MKEIKFRGKTIQRKINAWVFGTPIFDTEFKGSVCIHERGSKKYILVDPKSLNQYTNLKDKNGKEIYFVDILEGPWGRGEVEFNSNWARICVGEYSLTGPVLANSENIGNFYENPELIPHKSA